MNGKVRILKIFISSPSDLNEERNLFPKIVSEVNRIKANSIGIQLEPMGWENTLPGKARAQELINKDLEKSDLVVMLLWKRWGTPTGKYSSGFEEEYELAKSLNEATYGKPEIFSYFRDVMDISGNIDEQLKKVFDFREKMKAENKCLYCKYENVDEWAELFREHLCRWLDSLNTLTTSAEEKYKMLQKQIDEKSHNFIGREFVFAELEDFLEENNRGYFIIKGEPGVGKTSLLAYLAKKHQYVCHFNDELSGIVSAKHFLQSVCTQLVGRYMQGQHYIIKKDFLDGQHFNQLLEKISSNLPEGERIIILVDALDESEKTLGDWANWLYLPSRLPLKVYFVVTTRPLCDMQLFTECPQLVFSIESDSKENLADVRRYIETKVKKESLLTKLQIAQVKTDEFVETLLRKSEGNFMYLHYIIPELESGRICTNDLPQGLMGYYERHWQKMKSADLNNWINLQQPVICVLAAIQEPVTLKQMAEFTRILTPIQVAAVITNWRQFIKESCVEKEKRYRLYHRSFQDFLKKKDEVCEVDLKQTNRNIAEVLKQLWNLRKGNS